MASFETPSPPNAPANVSSQTHLAPLYPSHITNVQITREVLQLYRAALQGNWEAAKRIFDNDPRALNIWVSEHTRVLQVAVGTGKKAINFVQKLVAMMSDDELVLRDPEGWTALSIAAIVGNKAAATILVNRMPNLLYIPDNSSDFPIQTAAQYGQRDVLEYLISVTKDNVVPNPYAGIPGLRLLKFVIDAEFLDIALCLVDKYPSLATLKLPDDTSALEKITEKMSVLMNRRQLKFYESSIFFLPQVRMTTRANEQALELVKCLCKQIEFEASSQAQQICNRVMFKAAKLGVQKVVEAIVEIFPGEIYATSRRQYIFHIAVENRCEDVFNLIYQMSDHKHMFTDLDDFDGNNLLHLAGKLAPSNKLNQISGAALQMQRELQWFKRLTVKSLWLKKLRSIAYVICLFMKMFLKIVANVHIWGTMWYNATSRMVMLAPAEC